MAEDGPHTHNVDCSMSKMSDATICYKVKVPVPQIMLSVIGSGLEKGVLVFGTMEVQNEI
jgi:hypothetical protein